MNTRDLIDGIVQQTTVLIAQISTASGIRAPLAHVADQVFVELAREIEAQGVGRKIVADMFGLALRSYQKKMRRLNEGATVGDRSLWAAVLDALREEGRMSRQQVLTRFRRDPEEHVGAVLNDLVGSGFVYCTGRGNAALFGLTDESDRSALFAQESFDSVTHLVWMAVYRSRTISARELHEKLNRDQEEVSRAIDVLVADGRIVRRQESGEDLLSAEQFTIAIGAEQGWESAVLDHVRAMFAAIGAKLRRGGQRSAADDVIGGATLSFDIEPGHPHADAVYGLLRRIRADVNALWNEVTEHNRTQPVSEDKRIRVYFYMGQTVEEHEVTAGSNEGVEKK